MTSSKTMRIACVGCLAALIAMSAESASAHHSFAAYDMTRNVAVEGTIKSFLWTAPHSRIDLLVADKRGGSATWRIETGGPGELLRMGWKKDDAKGVRVGDKVTIVLHPKADGSAGGSLSSIKLGDGRVLHGFEAGPGGPGTPPPVASRSN